MSGHSKWKTIKYTKGAKDAKRGNEFTKISKEIAIAAQLGGSGDINSNYLLRVPVEKARTANMPNDKIENAIKRGLGLLKDENITYSTTYEAYAPDGTALLIDCTTDNPTRTVSEVKTAISKNGGKVLNEGSISWKFKEVGRIVFEPKDYSNLDEDYVIKIIDQVNLEDIEVIQEDEKKYIYLIVAKELLKQTTDLVINLFDDIKIEEAAIVKIPNSYSHTFSDELESFIEKIEEVNDVDKVWSDAN